MFQKLFFVYLCFLLVSCSQSKDEQQIIIKNEHKFEHLFNKGKYEASGIVYAFDQLYIVFDNMRSIATLDKQVDKNINPLKNQLNKPNMIVQSKTGYEGIDFDKLNNRILALVEVINVDKQVKSEVHEYSLDLKFLQKKQLDFNFKNKEGEIIWKNPEDANKGFEGIAHFQTPDNQLLLLALCEGNNCASGKKSKNKGHGKIQIFTETDEYWKHLYSIDIPKQLDWSDYSGLDVQEDQIAIVSQENAQLWIGKLNYKNNQLSIKNKGTQYNFPDNYCNIEGVSFLDKKKIAVVSDRVKKDKQPKKCEEKDQSIHFFKL